MLVATRLVYIKCCMLVSWHCCFLQDFGCMREGERGSDSGGVRTARRFMYYAVCISMFPMHTATEHWQQHQQQYYMRLFIYDSHAYIRPKGSNETACSVYSLNCCIRGSYYIFLYQNFIGIPTIPHCSPHPLATASFLFALHFAFCLIARSLLLCVCLFAMKNPYIKLTTTATTTTATATMADFLKT